jgi:hypothetical protein
MKMTAAQARSAKLGSSPRAGTVSMPMVTARIEPKEFGIQDETITVISATHFLPQWSGGVDFGSPVDLGSLGRYCNDCAEEGIEYFANLDIPAGAIIDFIGVNNASDTDAVLGVALWQRDRFGNVTLLNGFSFPAHGWDTDFAGPLGIPVPDHVDKELVLNVEQAASANPQYFGWVQVHWHRTVSPAPLAATFGDVPTNHPFFQFVEALASSGITGGCGNGNYCPDNSVTRGQMAVFLAKALGLHWPH